MSTLAVRRRSHGSRGGRHRGRSSLIIGLVLLWGAGLVAPVAGEASAPPPARTTHFTGRITSASGRYAQLRGAVRLVLHIPVFTTPKLAFTLVLSAPPCRTPRVGVPRSCVSLAGKLTGTAALSVPHTATGIPKAVLAGAGRLTPLGPVQLSGRTSGLGLVTRGRIPLTVRLRGGGGTITIQAHGPLQPGLASPF